MIEDFSLDIMGGGGARRGRQNTLKVLKEKTCP